LIRRYALTILGIFGRVLQGYAPPGGVSTKRGVVMKLSTWVSKSALAVVLSLGVIATTQAQGPYRRGYEHYGPAHGFYGRDFRYFGPDEIGIWRGGIWRHEWHDGRYGWWWLVDGYWYYYPAPIYPYPTYVPEAVVSKRRRLPW